jgi:hypothetical protein
MSPSSLQLSYEMKVPASFLRAKCDVPFIGSEADLDQWLAALRAAAAEDLKKGNRISL